MKLLLNFTVIFLVTILTASSSGKNILFFFGLTNYSHRISLWPLIEQLAAKGHNVTCFSSHPAKALKNPKVTEIVPQVFQVFTEKWKEGNLVTMRLKSETEYQKIYQTFPDISLEAFELLLEDKEFLNWYNSAHYDFVFVDALGSEFAFGLAHKFKAQYALMSTTSPYMWQADMIGSPLESSWMPDMQIHFPDGNDMTFVQKIQNTFAPIWWEFQRRWDYYPRLEKLLKGKFGLKDLPGFLEMERNVSFVLTNTHFSEEYGRTLPPAVIPIGGMHCNYFNKEKTPKDLEAFMNGATGGFMYMSMGSGAQVSNMPPEMQHIFFNAFEKANIKVVLQWKDKIPKDMPKNVFPAAWLPQQNILAHPNIKGFLTHGGLLGMHEAICSAVPLIVLPLFGEQDYNGNRVHKRKLGIKLELRDLTQEGVDNAIWAILNDPDYKNNMIQTSKLFLDRQNSPVDTAIWWTEYALRHGHVKELKPLGIYQTWWQRRLLDVWLATFAALTLVLSTIVFITVKILKKLVQNSSSNTSNPSGKQKKGAAGGKKAKVQ